jgi:hypothetical protein
VDGEPVHRFHEVLTLHLEQGENSMPTILKRLGALLVIGLLCLAAFPASGIAEGNSEAADICKQGGYADLTTSSGATFDNTGECVSYAAQGNEFGDGETIEVTPEPTAEPSPQVTPVPEDAWVTLVVGMSTGVGCILDVTGFASGYETVYVQLLQVQPDGTSYPAYLFNRPVEVAADGSFTWQDTDLFIVVPTDVWIGVYDSSDYWANAHAPLASSEPQTCVP